MKKTFKVDGMTCQHCERTVKEGLLADKRIDSVRVDLKTALVNLECDPSVTMEEIKEIIRKAGYTVID